MKENSPFIPHRPFFISFEGIEGCGKTTQAEKLKEKYASEGISVLLTFEPGDSGLGACVREILLNRKDVAISAEAEALLYAADRIQHVNEIIIPALKSGSTVICDRYIDSSLVYQGIGRNLGIEIIESMNIWATRLIKPDITFLIDLPVNEGLSRIENRGLDRLESESIEFHEIIRNAYLQKATEESERIVVIDGRPSAEEVFRDIVNTLQKNGFIGGV